jgi:serine protease Do
MARAALVLTSAVAAGAAGLLGWLAGGGGVVRAPAGGPPAATLAPRSFADIAAGVNPAVVNLSVVGGAPVGDEAELPPDHPPIGPGRGEGSGFIVDPAGYILTNHHVVAEPARILVRLADGRELPGRLVGADPSTDIALVKVEAGGLPVVRLGDSDRLRVGDWVAALGNPYGFDHSITVGVVSSKGRKIYDGTFDSYIQTDAAINPGNSGGPLVDLSGDAVGINSAVSLEGQGIGFAIPINVAREIMEPLKTQGRVTRGFLGIQLQAVDADLQRMLGAPEARGAMVLDFTEESPGAAAGLRRYDVITSVSGREVGDGDELVRLIAARPPGSEVDLGVVRDGRPLVVRTRLAERQEAPAPEAPAAGPKAAPAGDALGLMVAPLSRKMQAELHVPGDRAGVVVQEVVGLAGGLDELAHGDLVVEVNRRPTPDLRSYQEALRALAPGQPAWLFVYRPRPAGTFLVKAQAEGRRP